MRKDAGFESTVEENAKRLCAEYRSTFTVEEVNNIRAKNREQKIRLKVGLLYVR